MSDYKKKKQLLKDNEDIFISEYDKNLSYDALSRIIDAKKDYINAAKESDHVAMTKANDVANAVRAQYGSYTGGEDGTEYHPFGYYEDDLDAYESKYEDELDRLYEEIIGTDDKFRYDYESDPVYRAYKKIYTQQGNLAYDRALANNSLKTGGVANTHAQSAAIQALGYYNSQLAAKIPELYEAAYDKYRKNKSDKLNRLKDTYELTRKREDRDYQRFVDRNKSRKENRDFLYDQQKNIGDDNLKRELEEERILADFQTNQANNDLKREQFEANNNLKREQYQMDNQLKEKQALYDYTSDSQKLMYEILRDAIDDEKWKHEYNLDAYKLGHGAYNGNLGTGDILSYARKVFNDSSLTMDDLYRLFGIYE